MTAIATWCPPPRNPGTSPDSLTPPPKPWNKPRFLDTRGFAFLALICSTQDGGIAGACSLTPNTLNPQVLENVKEMWTEAPRTGKGKGRSKPVNKVLPTSHLRHGPGCLMCQLAQQRHAAFPSQRETALPWGWRPEFDTGAIVFFSMGGSVVGAERLFTPSRSKSLQNMGAGNLESSEVNRWVLFSECNCSGSIDLNNTVEITTSVRSVGPCRCREGRPALFIGTISESRHMGGVPCK